jgi:hypothetical protein
MTESAESLNNPGIAPSLILQDGWKELYADPENEHLKFLDRMAMRSMLLAVRVEGAEDWGRDNEAIRLRWQHAAENAAVIVHRNIERDIPGASEADHLRYAIGSIEISTNTRPVTETRGWEIPGISFRLSRNKEGAPDIIDLRDMDEPVSRMPAEYESFKELTDEEVDALRERIFWDRGMPYGSYHVGACPVGTGRNQRIQDMSTFWAWSSWRRFGVPDSSQILNDEELEAEIINLVDSRIAADPEYGKLPKDYTGLTSAQRQHVDRIYRYMIDFNDLTDQPSFDQSMLLNSVGTSTRMSDTLTDKGVLERNGRFFTLAKPYLDLWLRMKTNRVKRRLGRSVVHEQIS